ncbi:MAG: CinA family protein, partial [Atopobium sp.]|nr:CinA family protein [Atopobium sp.]
MFSEEVLKEAQSVISDALASGITVASAESCTGGLVAGALTAISGSSSVLKGS